MSQPEQSPRWTPVEPPREAAVRRRRSPKLIALGVLLVCLGGLLAFVIHRETTASQTVVVMTRTVLRGEKVSAADLSVTTIGSARGVSSVDAGRRGEIIGRHALVDLPAGSLVGAGSVGDLPVQPGSDHLGLRLPVGRLPLGELPPGSTVALVGVPPQGAPADPKPAEEFSALVITAPTPLDQGGDYVLDVAVAAEDSSRVARLAANDLVVLIRKGPR